jgi:hypothetical protein
MHDTRQVIAGRVEQAFDALGVIRGPAQHSKYKRNFESIANYLLSVPGTDEYKFVVALVAHMKDRGCMFVNPSVCANRTRMEEVSKQLRKPDVVGPVNVAEECRKQVRACISNKVCRTEHNALVSPVTGLPAWFRVTESGFDEEVVEYYGEAAKDELAKDPVLAKYVREQFPEWTTRSEKWSN